MRNFRHVDRKMIWGAIFLSYGLLLVLGAVLVSVTQGSLKSQISGDFLLFISLTGFFSSLQGLFVLLTNFREWFFGDLVKHPDFNAKTQ